MELHAFIIMLRWYTEKSPCTLERPTLLFCSCRYHHLYLPVAAPDLFGGGAQHGQNAGEGAKTSKFSEIAVFFSFLTGAMGRSTAFDGLRECPNFAPCTLDPGGGVLDFGLDGSVPPGPRDPNPCLEVKKVPMFRDFAQKMDPCLGIFWKFSGLALRAQKIFVILTKNGPMFRDFGIKNGTHV